METINFKDLYKDEIVDAMIKKFEYKNFKIMLHPTHKKEPQKGWHIAIQHKTLSGNWRTTIPDIPLKTLGKVFMHWAKNWLK